MTGRRRGVGWKKTRRGQHNDEKGILAGLYFQAALCKSVYFNSAAATFDLSLRALAILHRAGRLISMLLNVTTGYVGAFLFVIIMSLY